MMRNLQYLIALLAFSSMVVDAFPSNHQAMKRTYQSSVGLYDLFV